MINYYIVYGKLIQSDEGLLLLKIVFMSWDDGSQTRPYRSL